MFRGMGASVLGGSSRAGVGSDAMEEERWAKVQNVSHVTFVNTQVTHAALESSLCGQAVLLHISCTSEKKERS